MDDPVRQHDYAFFADNNPMLLLQGDAPHHIDEWQLTPTLWDVLVLVSVTAISRDNISLPVLLFQPMIHRSDIPEQDDLRG